LGQHKTLSRLFKLTRMKDGKNISGVGKVVEGVVFPDGKVVIQWQTERSSIAIFNNLEDFQMVHAKPIYQENQFDWIEGYEPTIEVDRALDIIARFVEEYGATKLTNKARGDILGRIIALKRESVKVRAGGLNQSSVRNVERNKRETKDEQIISS
jgi:hypothetical protein